MKRRLQTYFTSLPNDFAASIVVFLVALPLCLGIALGSNAPLFSGLIAGIVGGIVIGLLSGSQLSVSGPAAGLTAIVVAAIGKLPSFEAFLLAVVLCGLFQIILGFIRAGVLGDYVPNCVIKGMLAAIGLILILKQLPHMIGYDKNFAGDESFIQRDNDNTFSSIFSALNAITPGAAIIGIGALVMYILWEKFFAKAKFAKLLPGPLIVVLIAVGVSQLFAYAAPDLVLQEEHLVNIPMAGSASEFFSFFTSPDWSQLMNKQVWITGLTLALVASLETLLSIEAIDDLDPYQRVTPTNRELKAQGVGNLVSGLIGGLPITSVIVRSSANVNAGAKTKLATVYHGMLLLLCVAFIPAVLNLIPKAALAAVLIYTGYKLAKPSLFAAYYRKGWDQFLPFSITIAAILFTDLLTGVLIGIAIGLFFVIRSNFRTSVLVVNDHSRYLFRLRKDVSFLNKPIIKNKLEEVPDNASVLIDTSRADFIDKDIVEVIEDFMLHAQLKNIKVTVKRSKTRNQGFNETVFRKVDEDEDLVRTYEKNIEEVKA
ncbi:MAG TPA: SulP family inorganic anion transporter [Chitinophagaceae bacterium]|nr:SulP family inorganic anion transporter [Chitinophagaceae bacterium]